MKKSEWMEQEGGGPTGETHASCFISSHSPLSTIFFRLHSDFRTHSPSVGRNNVVPALLCFSCPSELRHNSVQGFQHCHAHNFFISFDQNAFPAVMNWTLDPKQHKATVCLCVRNAIASTTICDLNYQVLK